MHNRVTFEIRSVAQPGRALRSGRRGRWFEPSHSDQNLPPLVVFFLTGGEYISSELNKRKPSVQATDFVKDITGVAPLDLHKYFNETFDFWAQNNKLDAKSITEYNKNVSVTIDNWIQKFSNEYMQWRNKLQSMPGYNQFVTRLRGLMAAKNAEMAKHMLNRAMGD